MKCAIKKALSLRVISILGLVSWAVFSGSLTSFAASAGGWDDGGDKILIDLGSGSPPAKDYTYGYDPAKPPVGTRLPGV